MKQRDRNKINKGKFSPFCSFKANKARRRDVALNRIYIHISSQRNIMLYSDKPTYNKVI